MNATFQKFLKEANRTATKSEIYFALGVLFGFCSATVVAVSLLLTFKWATSVAFYERIKYG